MEYTTQWTPSFDNTNRAIGTFDSVDVVTVNNPRGKKFSYVAAIFYVEGQKGSEEKTQEIHLKLTENYSPNNNLGKIAKAMGFKYKTQMGKDNRGRPVVKSDNLSELDDLFESLAGQLFEFKMEQTEKNIWQIKPSSIRPLKVKEPVTS